MTAPFYNETFFVVKLVDDDGLGEKEQNEAYILSQL
jgi:hypothetical protein